MASYLIKSIESMGFGIWEYNKELSKRDEHYFKAKESSICWPFANIGGRLGFFGPGSIAGMLKAFEKGERD